MASAATFLELEMASAATFLELESALVASVAECLELEGVLVASVAAGTVAVVEAAFTPSNCRQGA